MTGALFCREIIRKQVLNLIVRVMTSTAINPGYLYPNSSQLLVVGS